jgi:hypothetical protein
VAAFVDDYELTELSDAVKLSSIMIEAIKTAAELDEGVLTRLRIDAERRTIDGKVVTPQPAQSHANSVAAMFTRKPQEPKCPRRDGAERIRVRWRLGVLGLKSVVRTFHQCRATPTSVAIRLRALRRRHSFLWRLVTGGRLSTVTAGDRAQSNSSSERSARV